MQAQMMQTGMPMILIDDARTLQNFFQAQNPGQTLSLPKLGKA